MVKNPFNVICFFATILGFIAAIMGFLSGLYFLVEYFIGTSNPEGWQTTILTILFLGGIQLIAIGFVGEYLGRLFLSSNKQPQFVVKEIIQNDLDA